MNLAAVKRSPQRYIVGIVIVPNSSKNWPESNLMGQVIFPAIHLLLCVSVHSAGNHTLTRYGYNFD